MRNITVEWLHKAAELGIGQEIYLPAHSKAEQKSLQNSFIRERKILAEIDPEAASGIHIYSTYRDARFWLVLKRVANSPLIGFIKTQDGTVQKVSISETKNREYRLNLMVQDKLSLEEIEELEGPLTEEEKKCLFTQ